MKTSTRKKQDAVYMAVREKILSGFYKPGDRLPTTTAMSKEMDCSMGMAGKVVALLIQEGLVEQRQGLGTRVIERQASELGAFAVLYPSEKYEGFARVINGFQSAARENDRRIVMLSSKTDFRKEVEILSRLSEFDVCGVVVCPTFDSGSKSRVHFLQTMLNVKIPVVITEDMIGVGAPFPSVTSDGFHAGYTMTRHLLDQGVQEIGFFSNTAGVVPTRDKYAGYCWAMEERGTPIYQNFVYHERFCHPDMDSPLVEPTELAREYLSTAKSVKGVVCSEDYLAVGMIQAAMEKGLRVPEDLKVTGIYDFSISSAHVPSITTYRPHFEKIGEIAFDLLVNAELRKNSQYTDLKVRGELVVRESTRRPVNNTSLSSLTKLTEN